MSVTGKIGFAPVEVRWGAGNEMDCSGEFDHETRRAGGVINLNPDQGGVFLLDTLIHEALHAIDYHRGLEACGKFDHQTIYLIANDLAEFLTSSGIVDPLYVEARLRKLLKNK